MHRWNENKKTGFTIVELLIVIVVIGILAAITIVAYNGIQTRAKDNSVKNLISLISKKAEAYRTVTGQYPNLGQFRNNTSVDSSTVNSGPPEARLEGGVSVNSLQANAENGTNYLRYSYQNADCVYLDWWDYTNNRYTSLSTTPKSVILGC